jgi:hypothetical protein
MYKGLFFNVKITSGIEPEPLYVSAKHLKTVEEKFGVAGVIIRIEIPSDWQVID